MLTPAAMTDGADGRLHAVGAGFGYASIDPRDGSTTQLALQDHPGSNRDLTNLPGTRDLYVVRDTAGDTAIDRLDIDNPSFVPTFTIPAPTLPDPVAITDGADGLLYVLGATGVLVPVDPATGPLPKVAFGAPAGTYVSATGSDAADAIYLLRVAGSAATVDVFDIASGLVTFDLATIDPLADAVSITDAAGGRLVVVGAGDPPAPRYVELDAATGATLVSHYCLDFDGANVAVTNLVADLSATPGEAGTADRPLVVNDYDAGSGMLSIRYGVACEAVDHTLHYGPLTHADLAAYNYTGEDCGIGNTGSYDTFDPGAGSYFFVVVANDGLAEGSYGVSEASGMQSERPNNVINPGCPLPQDLTDSCAP